MAEFKIALNYVLDSKSEGEGYSNHSFDRGGATKSGISLRFLKTVNPSATEQTIKELTKEEVENIYQQYFWNKILEQVNNQDVCNYIFDFLINANPRVAYQAVQRALWSLMQDRSIKDDGILGNITLDKINYFGKLLLPPLRAERAGYYRLLVAEHSDQIVFLNGWFNRCYRS